MFVLCGGLSVINNAKTPLHPKVYIGKCFFLHALRDSADFKVTENNWEEVRGNSPPARANALPASRGRCAPGDASHRSGRRRRCLRHSGAVASCRTGLVSSPVPPANGAQPCRLRLYAALLDEELGRLPLGGPAWLFGYRGATEPTPVADIQQIASVCFCRI